MKKTMRFLLCLFLPCFFLSFAIFAIEKDCPSLNYRDVPSESHWAHKGIDYVVSNGLMTGTGKNEFSPDLEVTREMMATILYRMSGSPGCLYQSFFLDVPEDAWYANAVVWCRTSNVILGYKNNNFGVGDQLTREQLSVMLERYTKYCHSRNTNAKTNLSRFADTNQISEWALASMKWAVACNLLQGTGENNLSPRDTASRAQLATILMRYNRLFDPSQDVYATQSEDGSLFSLNPDQIEAVTIMNPDGKAVEITNPEKILEVVDQLNSFRFYLHYTQTQTGMTSYDYNLILSGPAGEEGYPLHLSAIEVDGVLYYGSPLYFSNLIMAVIP